MNTIAKRASMICLLLALVFMPAVASLSACSSPDKGESAQNQAGKPDTSRFIVAVEDEPDTVDFQCTSLYYTVANNVFSRLVETEADANGNVWIAPSLAESWEVSDDRRSYTFHLRNNVTFSNGSALTSSDVLYSFSRLLTHPNSCNRDIIESIVGAKQLENGEASQLEGFKIIDDMNFTITLEQPFEAFLSCLSMAGASIMDEQTTQEAGERFGTDPAYMMGTGPYILRSWEPHEGMTLVANPHCFDGAPLNEGLDLRFITEPEEARLMFEKGELDILDLDDVPDYAEYYVHGDIYQDRLYNVNRIGLVYIALNESVAPLNDARVRKALQLSLERLTLLDAVYSSKGTIENGIYPYGLYGYNPQLAAIPHDTAQARRLLEEAGYPGGFDLTVGVRSSSTQSELTLMRLAAAMWEDVGVHASIQVMSEEEFMQLRKSGNLACYTAMWTADYNDPDTFIYTFFGNRDNTTFRSICYQNDDVMNRVHAARAITDADARLQEYRDLERIIVQEDAAWIPLFSRQRVYVMSERIKGIPALWNGSVKSRYRALSVSEAA